MTMVQAVTRREFLHLSSGTLAGFMLGRQGFSDDKKGQGDEFGGRRPARLPLAASLDLPADGKRSEERRVGKECRSRWSPYH